jgi:hypothetical protein
MFPVFLNAVDVACTVTFSNALCTPHFLRISQARNTVNFLRLAKVCKRMGEWPGEYLRTGWLQHTAAPRMTSLCSGAVGHDGQFAQCSNTIRQWRVRAE